jgi:hypothetical protein
VVPYQRIELAMPETGEKAEWIRSEPPAKLRKRESLQHARARHAGAICHPFIKTMLSRRHQLSPSERRSAHFSWREVPRESAILGKAPGKPR